MYVYASDKHPYNKVILPSSLKKEVVTSSPIADKTPVAPLLDPVMVSPTVNDPLGIGTLKTVDEFTLVTVVDCPLVDPVIVSEVVNVPDTLVIVRRKVLLVMLVGR